MRPRRIAMLAAPFFVASLWLLAPGEAQEQPYEAGKARQSCEQIAQPALRSARADADRLRPAEIQKRLPELLERFAAQDGLSTALACLMRTNASSTR